MPAVDDIFRVKIVSEMHGVSMANILYWQIEDLGTDGLVADQLNDLLTQYHTSIQAVLSDEWKLTCGIYVNITAAEAPIVVFKTLAGADLNSGHPSYQVVRFNRYTTTVAFDKIHRGSFNQSGVRENASLRGRLIGPSDFVALNTFLSTNLILDTDGWTVQPHLRWRLTVGPPPTYTFTPIIKSQVSTVFRILRGRKTELCATV